MSPEDEATLHYQIARALRDIRLFQDHDTPHLFAVYDVRGNSVWRISEPQNIELAKQDCIRLQAEAIIRAVKDLEAEDGGK